MSPLFKLTVPINNKAVFHVIISHLVAVGDAIDLQLLTILKNKSESRLII